VTPPYDFYVVLSGRVDVLIGAGDGTIAAE
jgi:hypothetical protein